MARFVKVKVFLQAYKMEILQSYRSSCDHREVLRILQKSSLLQGNILWQSYGQKKQIVPISHFEIDFVFREVVAYFDTTNFKLDTSLPLYAKLNYRQGIFKSAEFRQAADCIHFPFPNEIKTVELRDFPRHQFLPGQEKVISLRASTGTGNELFVRAYDVSQYGMGIIVSEINKNFLKNNRVLWITSLGPRTLQSPVLCEIIYMNGEVEPKFQLKKQKDLKVGLRLSGIFPEHDYQRFIQ